MSKPTATAKRQRRHGVILGSVLVVCACGGRTLAGPVSASWIAPVSGDWTEPDRWSSHPFYPNNGSPADALYSVFIAADGPDYVVTLADPVAVGSTVVQSAAATLAVAGGTFTLGQLGIGDAGAGRFGITGGTLDAGELSVGKSSTSPSVAGDGTFEQTGGSVTVRGPTFVGYGASTFSAPIPATGTLIISGPSRYASVPPLGSTTPPATYIGFGSLSQGMAQFSNFATVTLGRAEVGADQGAGTMLIDGARVSVDSLYVGRSASSGAPGVGTLILRSGRLSVGSRSINIGSDSGSGHLLVNGGTLTIQPASPVDGFFMVRPTGTITVNPGATVDSQRNVFILGGQFIINGGTVSFPQIRVGTTGGGSLTIHNGRLTTSEVRLSSSKYLQTGGTAALTSMQLSTFEGSTTPPDARLAGGTFTTSALGISSGTFTYQAGAFEAASLTLTGGRFVTTSGRDKTLRVGSLSISGSARLDLGDNFMLLDSGTAPPLASIRTLLRSGYNNGSWDGPGIISSVAPTTAGYGIGYIRPSVLFTPLLVAYTRYGDADLDGFVDLSDFNALAGSFGQSGKFWSDGDFNYDGIINLQDFNRLAANFGLSASPDGPTPDDWANLASAVPEPAWLAGVATLPLVRLRRRAARRAVPV